MKKIIYTLVLTVALIFNGCTDKFDEANTNPYQISQESLKQDFNHIGSYYNSMLAWVNGYTWWQQVAQNLCSDSWVRYLGTPTPFVGGSNNTTYNVVWKHFYWAMVYNNIMAPSKKAIELAEADGYDVFAEWARLIRVLAISKLTLQYGPVIYSDYGSTAITINYDGEEDLYNQLFADLDGVLEVFSANTSYDGLNPFDASYGGDVNSWIKLINSMRLRLAMRISDVNPSLAQQEAEKAASDPGGLIMTGSENFEISLYGQRHPLALFCFGWNDTRMSATMESVLVGYKDNRIGKYFSPVDDASLVTDHPDWPYKGIRNGAEIAAKDQRTPFSTINESFDAQTEQGYFRSSETLFLLAEGTLKGWSLGAGSVKDLYEEGVRESFAQWGAGGVDAYLADDSSTPIDYDDPKAEGDVNDFVSRMDITIMWEESANDDRKLERIITQKWIAGFPNSWEPWADHSRTDYPKIPYNYKNTSNADGGIIPADGFIKRMKFVPNEYTNNPEGVAAATQKLSNGKDEIGTPLWWDIY